MTKLIFRAFLILIAGAAVFGLERFCNRQTDGFALHKITSDLSYNSEWDIEPVEEGLKKTLSQKYYYLGKGVQCYAFLSEDGNYVLKFLRHDHMRVPLWLSHLPLPPSLESYRKAKEELFYNKMLKDFRSYKMAYDGLKEETGLIYLHLNKSGDLKQKVAIFDKIGVIHQIDLDKMEFLLQRRAEHVYPEIKSMMEKGDALAAKRAISSLVHLIVKRSQLGLYDKDPDILTNFGIIGDRFIQIDVGRYRRDEARKDLKLIHEDLIRVTDKFKNWLDNSYPELGKALEEQIEEFRKNNQL